MPGVRPLVLDASTALSWLFEDEGDDRAMRILEEIGKYDIVVPPIWTLEISNALLVAERRNRSMPAQTEQWIELLSGLDCAVDIAMAHMDLQDILPIARTATLSSYDASYLSLASRMNAPLATIDSRMQKAAKKIGVSIL
jgi:predicted nucleic acid-binding protein